MMDKQKKDKEAAAVLTGNDQAGQLRPVPFRKHPRMVYADPDEFFADLLMEQNEQQ